MFIVVVGDVVMLVTDMVMLVTDMNGDVIVMLVNIMNSGTMMVSGFDDTCKVIMLLYM
jgi:hypothetical protein